MIFILIFYNTEATIVFFDFLDFLSLNIEQIDAWFLLYIAMILELYVLDHVYFL